VQAPTQYHSTVGGGGAAGAMDGLGGIYDPRSLQPSSAHHSPTYPHSGPTGPAALQQYGGYGVGGGGSSGLPQHGAVGSMGGGVGGGGGGGGSGHGGVSSENQLKRDKDSVYG